jgi:PAS domain S-box-containing protein
MKIITAVCFILAATSLLIIQLNFPSILRKILPRVFAVLICLTSLITIYVYFYSLITGHEISLSGASYFDFFLLQPGRMALLSALSFFLIGCIIYLLTSNNARTFNIAHAIIIPVVIGSYFVIVSYILGVYSATEILEVPVALNTGIAFFGICIAVLLIRQDTWLLRVFLSADTGGIFARKLLPGLMVLPLIIGWFRIRGERIELFKSEEGVVLVAITYTICFLILVLLTARSVNKTDQKRRVIEKALKESEERLKAIAEASPVGFGVVDVAEGNFLYVNPAYEKLFGYESGELLSKKALDLNWDSKDREIIAKKLKEQNFVSNYEAILKRKDGSTFWSMSSFRPITFMNKPALLGSFMDITKSKETEEALRNNEQRLKYHIENSPLAIIEWDKDYFVTQWSEAAEKIFGWKKEETIGKKIDKLNIIYEEDFAVVEKTMERLSGGRELNVISLNRNYTRSKEIRECIWYNSVLPDEEGQMSSVMSLVEDVTEIRKFERLLKESQEKLLSVLNATQESIHMFDRNGVITMSNSIGLERLKKNAANEVVGHHFSEFVSESTFRFRQAKLDHVFSSGKSLEFEDERDGRTYNHNFFPVFKDDYVSHVVAYSTDITERKRAESNLKESEDRFRTIAESLPVLISIYSTKYSKFSFVNESYEKIFGFKKGELIDKNILDFFYNPEDRLSLGNTLKEKGRVYNKELRVKKTDGTPFWIMTSIRKIMFMNEVAYLIASIDITETKKVQEELLQLNRTLNAHSKSSQAMMHSNNELNYIKEVCKIIIEDCGHAMIWVGYAENDRRKSVKPVAHYGFNKGYIDRMNITWDDTVRGRGPTGVAIRTGKISICKNMLTDPTFKPWRQSAIENGYASSIVFPLKSDGKPFGAISIYSKEPDPFSELEITLLSELADDMAYGISFIRLTESEREAARIIKESESKLKELIATKDKFFNIVAHDLKNPFTSLLGSSELLYNNIDQMSVENIRKLAIILNDSAKGGYSILQNLLDWSRSQTGLLVFNPQDTNLKTIIDENIENLQLQTTTKGISLTSDLTDTLFIFSDRNMINTVLRNLLSNAIKYTHKNGKVVVGVLQSSKEIIVSVKDTGTGMTKEKVDSLFRLENSLSTPGTEKEQGTGLGLKLCKEFTEKMGGRIWVESNEGQGSEFKFTIPLKGTKV